MKQLLILSGKGGTGKTTIASAFIKLAKAKAYADCDVDAPNLHLVMEQTGEPKCSDYYGLPKATIDQELCKKCGICMQNCRFDAIRFDQKYMIDYYACEGCGVCEMLCPVNAISLSEDVAGELRLYNDRSVFSTATLRMGSGTSGMLVSRVKSEMKQAVLDVEIAVIDGSPGIGCPVIASLSGVDMVLIVTEPSVSGISDMVRIIETAQTFNTKIAVCVNKYDTNLENTKKIITYCEKTGITFAGTIPFDGKVAQAINQGSTIIDIECNAGEAAKDVFKKTMKILFDVGRGEI